ncbi:ankyrin-2-like [Haliotis rufescens]|uniref:ankyrin-2-like n=1 Tax=Haliotis rufescens TaxID=6454 RepID=UPI00201EFB4A|nr:ankyrin-2-like [Haliotis rufescens]
MASHTGNPTFENMVESTRALMEYEHSGKHVSTYAERSAFRTLKRFGCLFIKGISGSGKSNLGLRLMAGIASETSRTPVIITAPSEWNMIPQTGQTKYIVMLDDIFGSSNMIQGHVDRWLRTFNIIWPIVEAKHIFLIMTSRPDVYDQCASQVDTSILMQHLKCITLDKDEYKLKVNEKKRFLKVYCGRSCISKEDMDEIAETAHSSLGFPQCCRFFASSRQAQSNGKTFFLKPFEFLAQEIDILEESDPFGYFVLLLVLLHKGQLKTKTLDTREAPETFQNILCALQNISHSSTFPSRSNIRLKANSLCDSFLTISDNHYTFSHQSIFDAVFLKMAPSYKMCIGVCPVMLLVEKVRESSSLDSPTEDLIILTNDNYYLLADRITEIMVSEKCLDVLDHPSLKEKEFAKFVFQKWSTEDMISRLLNTTFGVTLKAESPNPLVYLSDITLFECDNMLSCMALKGNVELVMLLLPVSHTYLHASVLRQIMACAIYGGHHQLYEILLQMGVHPDNNCFRALCAVPYMQDISMIHGTMYSQDVRYFEMLDFTHLFTLLALNHNRVIVDLLLKQLNTEHLSLLSKCVINIFEVLSSGGSHHNQIYNIDDTLQHIIEALLTTGCNVNPESLLYRAASHVTPSAMRCVFKVYPGVNVDKTHHNLGRTPLTAALEFGGLECLALLLEHDPSISVTEDVPSKANVMHMAAKSKLSSKRKMEMIYERLLSEHQIPQHELGIVDMFDQGNTKQLHPDHFAKIKCLVDKRDFMKQAPLHIAAANGNVESVRFLISIGAMVDIQDGEMDTPLHLAASFNHLDCIYALLEAKASVEIKDSLGYTPLTNPFWSSKQTTELLLHAGSDINHTGGRNVTCLLTAVQYGDIDQVRLLCNKGADPNAYVSEGSTVLFEAVLKCDLDMITCLCEHGARLDLTNETGCSLVHIAAASKIDPVEKLIYILDEKHSPVDVADDHGRTAMFPAVLSRNAEILEVLLERHFDRTMVDDTGNSVLHVLSMEHDYCEALLDILSQFDTQFLNIQSNSGATALHLLAEYNNASGTRKLLERGAHPSLQDHLGMTPLHNAVLSNSFDCIQLLLQYKGVQWITDTKMRTALHYAFMQRNNTCVQPLLNEEGLDVNLQDVDGCTALHIAAEYGRSDNVKSLLDRGADPCLQDNKGKTALHTACEWGNRETVELLLNTMTNPFSVDLSLRSPLHLASWSCSSKTVKLLLDKGAYPFASDLKNRTPLHIAAKGSDSTSVKYLLEAKSDPCSVDEKGDTPLHCSAKSRLASNVKLLLESGAKTDIQNKKGNTALHLTAYMNFNKGTEHLLEYGADLKIQNHQGQTPLHFACQRGSYGSVHRLLQSGANASVRDNKERTPLHYALEAIKTWNVHFKKFADEYLLIVKALSSIACDVYARCETPLEMFLSSDISSMNDEDDGKDPDDYDEYCPDNEEYKKTVIAILEGNQ